MFGLSSEGSGYTSHKIEAMQCVAIVESWSPQLGALSRRFIRMDA
jgi:hypothetical protein